VRIRGDNEILGMHRVDQIIEEEEGEDGSKQSSNKPAEYEDFDDARMDSEMAQ